MSIAREIFFCIGCYNAIDTRDPLQRYAIVDTACCVLRDPTRPSLVCDSIGCMTRLVVAGSMPACHDCQAQENGDGCDASGADGLAMPMLKRDPVVYHEVVSADSDSVLTEDDMLCHEELVEDVQRRELEAREFADGLLNEIV